MGESANKLLEKIEVTKLPSLPQILVELLDICRSGDFAFEELVDILRNRLVPGKDNKNIGPNTDVNK